MMSEKVADGIGVTIQLVLFLAVTAILLAIAQAMMTATIGFTFWVFGNDPSIVALHSEMGAALWWAMPIAALMVVYTVAKEMRD